jgi:hypothetical protein
MCLSIVQMSGLVIRKYEPPHLAQAPTSTSTTPTTPASANLSTRSKKTVPLQNPRESN